MAGINLDAELDKFYPDPQQDDDEAVCYCSECNEPIFEGDYLWNLDEPYCDSCATKIFRYIASK